MDIKKQELINDFIGDFIEDIIECLPSDLDQEKRNGLIEKLEKFRGLTNGH